MIPIIHLLSHHYNFEVLLGLSGSSGQMLKKEFPRLKAVQMPSPRISYSSGESQARKILWQLPKILKTILIEHIYLKKLIKEEQISCVISDHRYGLFQRDIVNILVIHQIQMKFPDGLKPAEKIFNWIQYCIFRRFTQVWIPDFTGKESVAGSLSTPPGRGNFYNLGILSRFLMENPVISYNLERSYDIVVVLSGPEPQRSLLEEILIGQLESLDKEVLFVRGIAEEETSAKRKNIRLVSRLPHHEMAAALAAAGLVICRSGYSSIMDLMALGKKAILIPTPGQTEQEYLAEYLKKKGYFYSQKQRMFDISRALIFSERYCPPEVPDFSKGLYERLEWLTKWLEKHKCKHQNG